MRCLPSGVHALRQIKTTDTETSGSGQSELEENGLCRGNNAGSVRRRSRTPLAVRQQPCPTLPRPRERGQRAMSLRLHAGVVSECHGWGRLHFGVPVGDPARASPWTLAARRCRVPPWQIPGRGFLQAGNVRMEQGSSCPSSRRRGQHGVVSPRAPRALLPPAMRCHSPLVFRSLQSHRIAHLPRGWGGGKQPPPCTPGAIRHPEKRHGGTSQGRAQLWQCLHWGGGVRAGDSAVPSPCGWAVSGAGAFGGGGVWATLQPCPGDGTPPSEDRLPGVPESLRHQSSAKGMLGEIPGRPVSAGSNAGPFCIHHVDCELSGWLLLGVNRGFC